MTDDNVFTITTVDPLSRRRILQLSTAPFARLREAAPSVVVATRIFRTLAPAAILADRPLFRVFLAKLCNGQRRFRANLLAPRFEYSSLGFS